MSRRARAHNHNPNFSYDAAGNQTTFGSLTLSYDAENRQSKMVDQESSMFKRPLIIVAAAVPLLAIAALLTFACFFFSYGPRPISSSTALGLLNNCEQFTLGVPAMRTVDAISNIRRADHSEVNSYYADFAWRWKLKSEGLSESISEFEYKEGRWNLIGFRDQDGRWVDVSCNK